MLPQSNLTERLYQRTIMDETRFDNVKKLLNSDFGLLKRMQRHANAVSVNVEYHRIGK